MIKNYLSFSRRFIFTLFTVLIGVNLWGQEPEPINLANCTITINGGNPYLCTSTNVTVNSSEVSVWYEDEYDVIHYVTSGFTISIGDVVLDGENPATKEIGKYTLTVTGDGITCSNSKDRDFYVLPGTDTYYTISDEDDWNRFADCVNDKYSFDGLTVKLTPSSSTLNVTTMVDNYVYPFSGTFDGNNKTLNVSYSGEGYLAPFYYTEGATIKDLTVTGNIVVTENEYAGYPGNSAGLIYSTTNGYYGVYRNTIVKRVTVSVNITGKDSDDNEISAGDNCGGFSSYSSYLEFEDCVYNGKIVVGSNSGGFSGKEDDYENYATFENCIFNPAAGSSIVDGNTFGIVEDESTGITGCYYTEQDGTIGLTKQGTLAYKPTATIPAEVIWKTVNVNNTTVKGVVNVSASGPETYNYTGEDLASTIVSQATITFDGESASSPSQYTITFQKDDVPVSKVIERGDYKLVINGAGTYGGYDNNTIVSVVGDHLLGQGTELEPFIIATTGDWIMFANHVNNGDTYTDAQEENHYYSEAYYKLTNDITVSTMVGTPEHPFSGDFSGLKGQYAANTLTFNYGTSANPTTEEIVAPFRYTDGATIHSLIVDGAIYTNVGKEAGLIGVNTRTSGNNTTVQFVINRVNFICYEDLFDAEGGGYAYDGSGISFIYSSYEGTISANNYHGGFCGNANAETTSFSNCLFNPTESGFYWAQNFIFNTTGDLPNNYYNTCYYTTGPNLEESEQGTMVFVNTVPVGNIGKKLTTFHEKIVYKPVTVVISGVNKRYTWTGSEITVAPTAVTFDGINALEPNNYCDYSISPSPVQEVGQYTFTLTAPKAGATGEAANYLGTINQIVRVVKSESTTWAAMQVALNSPGTEITINLNDIIPEQDNHVLSAGTGDACLVIEGDKTVTINLQDNTIDRGFYESEGNWGTPVVGGQVLKVNSGATVIINGPGTIMGGCNKASSNTEHAENSDGGGIFNMGNLTLNDVTIEGNYCEKKDAGIYRTARGGGIYSGSGSKLYINNCTITHNEAKGGGGGLFVEKAAVFEMKNTGVRSNKSQDKGGGVRLNADGTQHNNGSKALVNGALIDHCVIENNTVELYNKDSASNGGGIHMDAGILDLTECTVDQNYASKFGGGIYMMGGTINASGCSISFNRSFNEKNLFEGCGGGVCVLGGTFKMIGGTITGNSSYISDGGGIYVATGKTLKLEGGVSVYGNWTYNDATITTQHTTNVYLAGTNDKITISGSITGASVGVSKKGDTGQFTKGLDGNGSVANFTSDNTTYQILPYTDTSVTPNKSEAKIGNPASWNDNPTPVDDKIIITEPTIINKPVTVNNAYTIEFSGDGCLIIGPNGVLTAKINNNDPLKLIIEDGGQVITTSTVKARVKKEILAFSATQPIDNWYLISSPISSPKINTETDLITYQTDWLDPTTPSYDLYRFNEAATETNAQGLLLQWENYRSTPVHAGFNVGNDASVFEDGRGYLYRNYYDYTITIDGTLTVGNVASYTLTNKGTNDFKGFNLIGNPYSHNIKKGEGQAIPNTYLEGKYYVLNPTGCQWVLTDDGTVIPPLTGILVQAKSDVSATQTLTISDIAPLASKGVNTVDNNNIWFTVANNKYEDKACVEFKEGRGLNKIAHMNEDAPMLYINYNGEDFASVDMNPEAKQFDLYFEAATLGQYTLTVNPQGNYSYLHLIDKVAEEDIDLLKENEYSFIGSPSDNADRFVVRLENSENAENSVFAYQSGNEIIVSGDGELQVFDVMGRLVARQYVSGVVTWRTASLPMGVYIFRLNDKSQKIVIR